MEAKEIYLEAIEKWGTVAQIIIAFEEMAELQKELCKNLRGRENKEKIAEEIADVENMMEQLKLIFDIGAEVSRQKQAKIARLEERLKRS